MAIARPHDHAPLNETAAFGAKDLHIASLAALGVSARFTSVELGEKPMTTPATASAPNVLAPSRRVGADGASAPPLTIALRPLPTKNTGPNPEGAGPDVVDHDAGVGGQRSPGDRKTIP